MNIKVQVSQVLHGTFDYRYWGRKQARALYVYHHLLLQLSELSTLLTKLLQLIF